MNIGMNRYINYLLFIIAISLFWRCSPEIGYGVRSFIFDGVPSPHKIQITQVNDSLQKLNTPLGNNITPSSRNNYYLHEPYKDKECMSCHDKNRMGKLKVETLKLCNECHDDFEKSFEVLHGPVASGNCLACHNPHKSKLKNLLVSSEQDLCLSCHGMATIFKDKAHKDIDKKGCIECHNPHGGRDNNFLINKQ